MTDTYKIQGGETLSGIAAKYGVSTKELLEANPNLKDPNRIESGQTINIPMVKESAIDRPEDSFQKTKTEDDEIQTQKEPWQNLEKMLDDGEIKAEKTFFGLFKTGNYNYTGDGKLTYGQLKDQLGIDPMFEFSKLNPNIKGSSNDDLIPKGTTVKLHESTLPGKPLTDKKGNEVDGFTKSLLSDTIYYTVQSGDSADGIYKKLSENKSALKGYQTADVMDGYSESSLPVGAKVAIYKKFLGIF